VPQFQQVKVKGRMLDYSLRNCPKPQSVRLSSCVTKRKKEKELFKILAKAVKIEAKGEIHQRTM